jgi:hypothetical protein
MSSNGIAIHYIGWRCQSPNPMKYMTLNGNFVFDLHDVFQEHNPRIKGELPAFGLVQWTFDRYEYIWSKSTEH